MAKVSTEGYSPDNFHLKKPRSHQVFEPTYSNEPQSSHEKAEQLRKLMSNTGVFTAREIDAAVHGLTSKG